MSGACLTGRTVGHSRLTSSPLGTLWPLVMSPRQCRDYPVTSQRCRPPTRLSEPTSWRHRVVVSFTREREPALRNQMLRRIFGRRRGSILGHRAVYCAMQSIATPHHKALGRCIWCATLFIPFMATDSPPATPRQVVIVTSLPPPGEWRPRHGYSSLPRLGMRVTSSASWWP